MIQASSSGRFPFTIPLHLRLTLEFLLPWPESRPIPLPRRPEPVRPDLLRTSSDSPAHHLAPSVLPLPFPVEPPCLAASPTQASLAPRRRSSRAPSSRPDQQRLPSPSLATISSARPNPPPYPHQPHGRPKPEQRHHEPPSPTPSRCSISPSMAGIAPPPSMPQIRSSCPARSAASDSPQTAHEQPVETSRSFLDSASAPRSLLLPLPEPPLPLFRCLAGPEPDLPPPSLFPPRLISSLFSELVRSIPRGQQSLTSSLIAQVATTTEL